MRQGYLEMAQEMSRGRRQRLRLVKELRHGYRFNRRMAQQLKREVQINLREEQRLREELDRWQEEERDRITALRNRKPASVGGIRVAPIGQGVSSADTQAATTPSSVFQHTREVHGIRLEVEGVVTTNEPTRRLRDVVPFNDAAPDQPRCPYQRPSRPSSVPDGNRQPQQRTSSNTSSAASRATIPPLQSTTQYQRSSLIPPPSGFFRPRFIQRPTYTIVHTEPSLARSPNEKDLSIDEDLYTID